jgi:ribosomal protein S18 acetylase RimI-like enzyme
MDRDYITNRNVIDGQMGVTKILLPRQYSTYHDHFRTGTLFSLRAGGEVASTRRIMPYVAQPVFFTKRDSIIDMEIEIRPAESSDINGIQSVATQAWHATHAPIIGANTVDTFLEEYYDTESFQARLDHDAGLLDVATNPEAGGVGYVLATSTEGDGTTFSLVQIYVDPDWQGEGIGQQLLDHIEQKISHRGGERLTLGVMAENDRAIRFYESSGYRRTGTFYDDRIETRGYDYAKKLA